MGQKLYTLWVKQRGLLKNFTMFDRFEREVQYILGAA